MAAPPQVAAGLAGRYTIERELGRGGTATVYLAYDLRNSRPVAIKILAPELAHSVSAERFIQEIRTAAALNHPHILALHDSGVIDGLPYYIMPYVEGETLRERLDREGPLDVADALSIACQTAKALAFAHGRGVIHRDIKPENILLSSRTHAYVADFGLARALSRATQTRLTATDVIVGSFLYISPEQAGGHTQIDGRSDVYSLGCVLFEMLCGEPPFPGPSPAALLAQHLTESPRSVRSLRTDAPPAVNALVERAMQKRPEDRPRDATEFATLLEAQLLQSGRTRRDWSVTDRSLFWLAVALVVFVPAAIALWAISASGWRPVAGVPLDSTSYAVVLGNSSTVSDHEPLAASLVEALSLWHGVTAVQWRPGNSREQPGTQFTTRQLARAARASGAANVILLSVHSDRGPELHVAAQLHDARVPEARPRRFAKRIHSNDQGAESMLAELADSLLFASPRHWSFGPSADGTTTRVARTAFDHAVAALATWDLAAAESVFVHAIRADAQYAQAHLWLAHVRMWANQPPERWAVPSAQAVSLSGGLSPRDVLRATAIDHLAARRFPEACASFTRMLEEDARDFTAWYGHAECHRRDSLVVSDAGSPSAWRFRASYQQVIEGYRRAFEIEPRMVRSFSQGGYAELRRRLYTVTARIRSGSNGRGERFHAYPEWQDSLLFVPWPEPRFRVEATHASPGTRVPALTRLRAVFAEFTARWLTAEPSDPEAIEARGVALEFTDPALALEAYRRARSGAVSPVNRLRAGAAEFWLLLKTGLPSDTNALRRARALADTLLGDGGQRPGDSVSFLATVAGLTGQIEKAAALAEHGGASVSLSNRPSTALDRLSLRALTYAAFGEVQRFLEVETEIVRAIQSTVPAEARLAETRNRLAQALMLAGPTHSSRLTTEVLDPRMPLARLLVGDTTAARIIALQLHDYRRGEPACNVTFDATYVDAWVMSEVGEHAAAAESLDRLLTGLPFCEPQILSAIEYAGPLLQAIRLRRRLAEVVGDTPALQKWGAVLNALGTPAHRSSAG